jgi:glycosyltransferase involved in cell wall biosynthesis
VTSWRVRSCYIRHKKNTFRSRFSVSLPAAETMKARAAHRSPIRHLSGRRPEVLTIYSAIDSELATGAECAPVGTNPTGALADYSRPQARVLHVINGEHYSGAERVQDLLGAKLPARGFEVGFACVKPYRFPAARQFKDTPLYETPMKGRIDLGVVRRLTQLIRGEHYELVHAHTPRTALVGSLAARKAGVPFIYHVHSPAGRDSTRRLTNWTNALVERAAVHGAARLVAVSPSLREHMLESGFRPEQVVYVPNGVPCAEIAHERRPPQHNWTLGVVALFRPRKGLEVLLETLALLRSRGANVRLRAVGGFETPAYESAILCLTERLGLAEAIDWTGFTKDVPRELSQIDVFVLPSLFGEGLPMVVLEAMAVGLPVIASRVEGVPEAVRHRETGLLVDPGSVSQLAGAIEEFSAGNVDYTALSSSARLRQRDHFSDTAMAAGVADVYRDVLTERVGTSPKP